MLEPYALKKTALYLILTPSFSPSPSLSCSSTTALLLKYFQELSIVYRVPIHLPVDVAACVVSEWCLVSLQNCNLGQHVPLEKGVGRGGLISLPSSGNMSPASSEGEGGKGKDNVKKESMTTDPKATTRHGPPAPPSQTTDVLCKKILSESLVHIEIGTHEYILFLSAVPLLASLPTSDNFVADYTSPSDYLSPSAHHPPAPLSIIIYVVYKGGRNNAHLFQLLHAFSELLESSDIPEATKKRLILQVTCFSYLLDSFKSPSLSLLSPLLSAT